MSKKSQDGSPSEEPSPEPPVQQGGSLLDTALQNFHQGEHEGAAPEPEIDLTAIPRQRGRWIPWAGWVLALALVAMALYTYRAMQSAAPVVGVQDGQAAVLDDTPTPRVPPTTTPLPDNVPVTLPPLPEGGSEAIPRRVSLHTIIPNRPRGEVISHTVTLGDSVFGLADLYNVAPETVLWANYNALNDNPDQLSTGMVLNIPPLDGVYYQWQAGDTLEAVASEFEVTADDILNYTPNGIDLAEPVIEVGQWIMVPEGKREFRQWLIPTINRGNAGVNSAALGPGACSGSYDGAIGSGAFQWPTGRHFLSGNDFWSGHLAIDIAAVEGDPIRSADAGVVVFSGWANGGYGYTVVVDHGNGYQTLYAHMSQVGAACGASVGAGSYLGAAGSTGNSTGTHLHFEVRFQGGFINPWFVLPPP